MYSTRANPVRLDAGDMPIHARRLVVFDGPRFTLAKDMPKNSVLPDRGTKDGAAAYKAWFDEWAGQLVEAYNADYAVKGKKPFDLATFDGCTIYPDICLPCCLEHDIRYHFFKGNELARKEADRLLRECALRFGPYEVGSAKHFWLLQAWAMWAAVRVFGWPKLHRVFFKDARGEGELLYAEDFAREDRPLRLVMPPNPVLGE